MLEKGNSKVVLKRLFIKAVLGVPILFLKASYPFVKAALQEKIGTYRDRVVMRP